MSKTTSTEDTRLVHVTDAEVLPRPEPDDEFLRREVEDNGCFDCAGVECTYMVHHHVWATAWPSYETDTDARRKTVAESARVRGYLPGSEGFALDMEAFGRLFLCLHCLSLRLGRHLRPDDFLPGTRAPCNRSIELGLAMGKAVAGR
jgi:hypothetical protein